jgi:hypothetical protein
MEVRLLIRIEPGFVAKYDTNEIVVEVRGENRSGVGTESFVIATVTDPLTVTANSGTISSALANAQGRVTRVPVDGDITVSGAFTNGMNIHFRLDAFAGGRDNNQVAWIDGATVRVVDQDLTSFTIDRPIFNSNTGDVIVRVITPRRAGEPMPTIVLENIVITGLLNERESYNVDVFVSPDGYSWTTAGNPAVARARSNQNTGTMNSGLLNLEFLDTGNSRELYQGTFESAYSVNLFTFGGGGTTIGGGGGETGGVSYANIGDDRPYVFLDPVTRVPRVVAEPFMSFNGNGYIAIRALQGIFGWDLAWSNGTTTFTAIDGSFELIAIEGMQYAFVNGEAVPMYASGTTNLLDVVNHNDRTYLPLGFLRGVFPEGTITWVSNQQVIIIPPR